MIRPSAFVPLLLSVLLAAPAPAQLAVPSLRDPLSRVGGALDTALDNGLDAAQSVMRGAADLARNRLDRLDSFVRRNRDTVEFDENRQPAKAGEVILLDPDAASLAQARARGYGLIERGEVEGLGIVFARLSVPRGESLKEALSDLKQALPGKTVSADQLHFQSGEKPLSADAHVALRLSPRGGTVGVIDGGMPEDGSAARLVVARAGFATGAPAVSPHAEAILSLLAGAGTTRVYSADVYGRDPAGGDALAIARALGWMVERHVPVVSISLVGPANPLLARAVAVASQRGTVVVAAVGNDGAAAPPAFPASYPESIAVTGIDGKGRVLIEAGRALHLDYAAPGADITAFGASGRRIALRGTSFAAPLAAARIAAWRESVSPRAALLARVDAEAVVSVGAAHRPVDSRIYGRGILCAKCREGT